MIIYMLFGNNDDKEGGGHDYVGSFESQQAAHEHALTLSFVKDPHMSSWCHLVEFDDVNYEMTVTHWLNIPDTEWEEEDELMWIAYEN